MGKFTELMLSAFDKEQDAMKYKRRSADGSTITIGASVACALKEYYDTTRGAWPTTYEEYVVMRKGNIAEGVFEGNLDVMGVKYDRQGNYHGVGVFDFMRVHPDILIDLHAQTGDIDPKGKAFIDDLKGQGFDYALVELKTSNAIPNEPHDYWIRQVNVQIETIANAIDIDPLKIHARVAVTELDYGRNGEFDIEYDPAEVMLAMDSNIALEAALTDWMQFMNKEKDAMELSSADVPRLVGNLCSMCKWAPECLGTGEVIELPDVYEEYVKDMKEQTAIEKNLKAHKEEIKQLMLKLGAKKGKVGNYYVNLQGGNRKNEIDPGSYSPEELVQLAKKDVGFVIPNNTVLMKIADRLPDEEKWIIDGHTREKITPISLRIMERKNI